MNFEQLTQAFNQWAKASFAPEPGEALAVDGRSIKVSLKDYDQRYQDFVSVVSVYSPRQGVVVGLQSMHNQTSSEITTVQTLLDQLPLQGVCFSLDALHISKTVEQIIKRGNDNLIVLKTNQPKLSMHLQCAFEQSPLLSIDVQVERTRSRTTQRTVSVLAASSQIDLAWIGLRRVIKVERTGTRGGKAYAQTVFYISSLCADAAEFAERIRSHWHIENRLHWCKDVAWHKDTTPLCAGHGLINAAILRTFALNLLRQHGFASLTNAIRQLAHDVHRLFSFCQ